jgi:hypothetical protein
MTEAEARKKWCPFALAALEIEAPGPTVPTILAVNRHRNGMARQSCRCLASDCMAWRSGAERGSGYCGLAGSPGARG